MNDRCLNIIVSYLKSLSICHYVWYMGPPIWTWDKGAIKTVDVECLSMLQHNEVEFLCHYRWYVEPPLHTWVKGAVKTDMVRFFFAMCIVQFLLSKRPWCTSRMNFLNGKFYYFVTYFKGMWGSEKRWCHTTELMILDSVCSLNEIWLHHFTMESNWHSDCMRRTELFSLSVIVVLKQKIIVVLTEKLYLNKGYDRADMQMMSNM